MPLDIRMMASHELPVNDLAEMALLGALLHSEGRGLSRVRDFLKPQHFASRVHERIYTAMITLTDAGRIADPIMLKQYFEADGDLADIGGYAYLMRLSGSTASLVNAHDYGWTIRDLAIRREIIALGEDIAARALKDDIDDTADAQVIAAETRLTDMMQDSQEAKAAIGAGAAAKIALETIDRAMHKGEGALVGLTTGVTALDRQIGGLHPGDLVIVAGRPGMGKTGLLGTIALAAARAEAAAQSGRVVLIFSLEMSAQQLGMRFLAEITGISADRQRRGRISDDEFARLFEAQRELDALPIVIDETPGATLGHMRARARRLHRSPGLLMVGIDHMQIVRVERRNDNRVADLTEISGGCKIMAKQLRVPVLALSQLSRAVESRDDKRPKLADLRESGSIEQDADVVLFPYRPSYYDKPPAKLPGMGPGDYADALATYKKRDTSDAEIIGAKDRHGGAFSVACCFDGMRTRWHDTPEMARDDEPDMGL